MNNSGIRRVLENIGVLPYIKYLRRRYFPSSFQKDEMKLIPGRLAFYRSIVSPGDLCFDVGANIGNRTEVLLMLGARVVAIEPQPDCAKMLRLRFGKKIRLIQSALGRSVGTHPMFLSDTSELSSLSKKWIDSVSGTRFKSEAWTRQIQVETTTLDNIIKEEGVPAFCKIDVEGFEEEVLEGVSQQIPMISLEYTVPERLENIVNCLERLSTLGTFECNYTIGEQMVFEEQVWTSHQQLISKLKGLHGHVFGDVYVKFIKGTEKQR